MPAKFYHSNITTLAVCDVGYMPTVEAKPTKANSAPAGTKPKLQPKRPDHSPGSFKRSYGL